MSHMLDKHLPQYGCVNGDSNTWIRKPSYNARGYGIFCINKRSEILSMFQKKASGPKIIQKYIERPLLIKNLNPSNPRDLRKFDIRQWVLLMSVEPTPEEQEQLLQKGIIQTPHPQVYIYKDAYLRLCGKSFDLSKLDDLQRHLSNFTIQKELAKETSAGRDQSTHANNNRDLSHDRPDADANTEANQTTSGTFLKDSAVQQEFVMSTSEFVDLINNEKIYPELNSMRERQRGKRFSWEQTFYPQIENICRHVFEKMSEIFDDNQNCFELFGFDFLIDANL